jgi:multidrug transporter EmrE-like cation transporter
MSNFSTMAFWMVLLTGIEAVGLILLRIGGLWQTVAASAIFAVGVVPLLAKTLEYDGIGMVNFIWNVFSTILMFGIGMVFFSEKVTRLKTIGILLSFVGLGLIMMSDHLQN